METLATIRTVVTQLLDEEGITVTNTRCDAMVSQAHRLRLSGKQWPFMLWPTTASFTCMAGESVYALHSQVGQLAAIENTTQDEPLAETAPADQFRDDVQDKYHFIWVADSPIAMGSSVGELLRLVSTNGADSGTLVVEGTDSSGEVVSETVTANGLTQVPFITTFQQIIRVRKSATGWAGTLKVLRTNGTDVVLTLMTGEYGRRYKRIQLQGTPSAGDVIAYTFYRLPRTISADTDVTDIPEPYDAILVWDTLLLLAAYNENVSTNTIKLWQTMQQQWETKLNHAYLHGRVANSQAARIRDGDPGGL